MFFNSKKNRKKMCGFNLIEAAIVLGVVGLVVGGIWISAAAVQQNLRNADASKGLLQIVQNIRNIYYGQTLTSTATITTEMIAANAFPSDFIQSTTDVRNPWNGGIVLRIAGAAFDKLEVDFAAVPKDSCIKLVSGNSNALSISLSQIVIDATTGGTDTTLSSFPVSSATAVTTCGTTNTLTWQFGLKS